MQFIADFHIHSKYSRATSKDMDVENLARWAKLKGISLLGTGDFTHHLWLEELKAHLEPTDNGLMRYNGVNFILTAEISSIYSKNNRAYRIHNIIIAPSFKTVDKINARLSGIGNLASDGRPILGLDAKDLVKIVLDIDPACIIVPAHCLLPDTFIHTSEGLKAIEDVTNKDYVYTHKLRIRKVSKLLSRDYQGKIFNIKPYYFREGIKTTPEHPVYIIKTYKNCLSRGSFCMPRCSQLNLKGCRRKFFNQYHPQWVQAKDIEIGDIMLFPRFNNQIIDKSRLQINKFIPRKYILKNGGIAYPGAKTNFINNNIKIDVEFCRLVGYFVSEGYTNSRDCVSFCFLEDESGYIQDVIILMKKIFGIELSTIKIKQNVKAVELIFYSKVLCNLFSALFYTDIQTKKAHSKSLPSWMLRLPLQKQAEIIKGWWRGDKGYTVSRVLMNQMKILLLRLGIIPSIGKDPIEMYKKRGKHFIGFREITARHDIFHFSNLSFFEDRFNFLESSEFRKFKTRLTRRHGWMDSNYVYLPVRKIVKQEYRGPVYNLEVEGDNSYSCEFATVHNCWTPWFSLFGSSSGFDKIEYCFEEQTKNIFALETGLSSDPGMNWRLSALDRFSLISNSDSHSPSKIGREANVFDCELDYYGIREALKTKDKKRFLYTIEFFPEEGKYHFDGHRNCGVCFSPRESKEHNNRCPKCGRPLTIGVMHRVDQLADRPEGFVPPNSIPFKNFIPLDEIIADARGVGKATQTVSKEYFSIIQRFGTEFNVLAKASKEELLEAISPKIAKGIISVREGKVKIFPGHDGEYGKIKIFDEDEKESKEEQLNLF